VTAARAAAEARPSRAPVKAGGSPELTVVGSQAVLRRARRRRARFTMALSASLVAGAMLVVAAAGSVVVSEQLRLDSVHAQVAAALAQAQSLQVEKATLESPSRILSIAEKRLGMEVPTTIHYLYLPSPAAPAPARPAAGDTRGGTASVPSSGPSARR
jgi:cell division protein FtsL